MAQLERDADFGGAVSVHTLFVPIHPGKIAWLWEVMHSLAAWLRETGGNHQCPTLINQRARF